jgi:hypothetical protein
VGDFAAISPTVPGKQWRYCQHISFAGHYRLRCHLIDPSKRITSQSAVTGLHYFMHQTFLVAEVVIKLSFSGPGRFNDLVRAGGARASLMEEICCGSNDP